jgi:hypothetical protein
LLPPILNCRPLQRRGKTNANFISAAGCGLMELLIQMRHVMRRNDHVCADAHETLGVPSTVSQHGVFYRHQRHLVCSRHAVPKHRITMSLKTVQLIVGRLVTDEEYRVRFLSDPRGSLIALRDQGVELTAGEIEALIRTDQQLWTDAAERIDPHLQRSSLRSEQG